MGVKVRSMVSDPYTPTERHPAPYNVGTASASSGSGSPEGVVIGSPGDIYADYATGDLYVKETGTGNTGWAKSGGTILVFYGSGSPEGVVTAPVGSIYTDITGGVIVAQYTKVTGSGNTGWG